MIDKLNNCPINTFGGSVYNFNELTLQELLSKFFSKINETVDTVNKAYEFWKWVQEQGISEETKKIINQMYQDGRLTEIINQLANDVKGQVQEIKTDLTNHKTEYEEFKTSTDETLTNHSSQLEQMTIQKDYNEPNLGLAKAHQLFIESYNNMKKVQYFMVGDSIRNSNGNWIFKVVSEKLSSFGVESYRIGKTGLALERWCGLLNDNNDPKVTDMIPLIEGDGSNTIVDISLGLNDPSSDYNRISEMLMVAINKIKETKPNVTFILTSPHKHGDEVQQKAHRYNLKMGYEKTINDNNGKIGYINVHDNVFPIYNNTIALQYTTDKWHPNEIGQRKIAEFIVSKLIPNYFSKGVVLYKGGINPYDFNYSKVKESGVSCEIRVRSGKTPTKIYLKYYKPNNSWYLSYNASQTLNNISGVVDMRNDLQVMTNLNVSVESIDTNLDIILSIKDVTVLNEFAKTCTNTTSIELVNCVVIDFTKPINSNILFKELNDTSVKNYKYRYLKGEIKTDDSNYNLVNATGFKINLYQTKGSIPRLWIRYLTSTGKWYLAGGDNANNIIAIFDINTGYQEVKNVDGASITISSQVTQVEFTAQIKISDNTQLKGISTDTKIEVLNYVVPELTKELTIEEHLEKLYSKYYQ